MKPRLKRLTLLTVAVAVPLGLLFAARQTASWRPQKLPLQAEPDSQLGVSPDGRYLLYGREKFHIHNLETNHDISFASGGYPEFCFAPNGRSFVLAAGCTQPTGEEATSLEWRSTESGRVLSHTVLDSAWRYEESIAFSARENALLLYGEQNECDEICKTGIEVCPRNGSRPHLMALPFSNRSDMAGWNEKWWAINRDVSTRQSKLEIYNVSTRRLTCRFPLESLLGCKVWFSPDSTLAFVQDGGGEGEDPIVSVLDIKTGRRLWRPDNEDFLFCPDSQRAIVQTEDAQNEQAHLELRSARTGHLIRRLSAPALRFSVHDGAIAPNGKTAYLPDENGQIWKIRVE